jgi:trehalose synthase-fused probable maltokinase
VIAERIRAGDLELLSEERLIDFVRAQRWFGSKAEEVAAAHVLDAAMLRDEPPMFATAVAEIRFQPGTHELYQLLLGFRPDDEGWDDDRIGESDGFTAYDALADPELARALVRLMADSVMVEAGEGLIEFRSVEGRIEGEGLGEVRRLGVEQSNTSVVFGDRLILKAYRRLEAGLNPELEMLRFLTERGFPNIAPLAGWYAYVGKPLNTTLGILQAFVPNAPDGWDLALAALQNDPDSFLARLRRLGEVTGAMHSALAGDATDAAFCPEEPSQEAIPLLVATVDEEIEELFLDLPDDAEVLAPVRGRGEEVRERLRQISQLGPVGRTIRHHGDYHLGQVLWDGDDWVVLDFEGEPARSLSERRRKRSPLRDVAGMLRSFAYAASASELVNGVRPPEGWEARARQEFLDGYFEAVERTLIPSGQEAIARLLSVFELEKAVYELRYELNHRPDWLGIPVAGILRLLEE